MEKLIKTIDDLRSKLDGLRRHALKETPTRTIIIDPLLDSMGWDVRDPDEVQLEYPTVDGKSVDYALKLNRKPALLVEAKALDDPLNDVKAITQVVGYAANDGIVWCILTNGVKWKVYRSVEKCQAPDKLMFEVSLDPKDSEGISVSQLARQMWRFSRDEMAKGTLDELGEQTFTDGKVLKALNAVMQDPPRPLLNMIRTQSGDERLSPNRIRESLARVWKSLGLNSSAALKTINTDAEDAAQETPQDLKTTEKKFRRHRAKKGESNYDEAHHTEGRTREVLNLYRALDRTCLAINPGQIGKRYISHTINYEVNNRAFCCVHLQQGGLRVWLHLKINRLPSAPSFAKDVSKISHWGTGDLELGISDISQIEEAAELIRMSFDAVSSKK